MNNNSRTTNDTFVALPHLPLSHHNVTHNKLRPKKVGSGSKSTLAFPLTSVESNASLSFSPTSASSPTIAPTLNHAFQGQPTHRTVTHHNFMRHTKNVIFQDRIVYTFLGAAIFISSLIAGYINYAKKKSTKSAKTLRKGLLDVGVDDSFVVWDTFGGDTPSFLGGFFSLSTINEGEEPSLSEMESRSQEEMESKFGLE